MEITKQYSVYLCYDTLLLLDGKCDEKTQKVIEEAKKANSFGLDDFSNEVIRVALERGELRWTGCKISRCTMCDNKPGGYETYARNSRNHYKGAKNYDAPLSYGGVQLNNTFIVMNGVSGICRECWYNIYLPKILNYIEENDLPIELQKNDVGTTNWIKDKIYICRECGKEMYESEMEHEPCMIGNGTYPSICPHCGAKSLLFTTHKLTDKFRMIRKEG